MDGMRVSFFFFFVFCSWNEIITKMKQMNTWNWNQMNDIMFLSMETLQCSRYYAQICISFWPSKRIVIFSHFFCECILLLLLLLLLSCWFILFHLAVILNVHEVALRRERLLLLILIRKWCRLGNTKRIHAKK